MSKNCCEYCKGSSRKRLEDKSEGFYSVRSYLEIGEQTTLVYDDSNDGTIKRTYGFQYCPMCGRYLREEEQQKYSTNYTGSSERTKKFLQDLARLNSRK